jgi:hypothetical protein
MKISVQNRLDFTIAGATVGTIIIFPNGDKEQILYKATDKTNGYFLTQVQTQNIKKSGELGGLTAWMKFRHYSPLTVK